MSFSQFDFHPELLQGLTEMGFEEPTPIQAQTIPLLLDNQDIIGLAQTGTGKTAAFALPIIQRLKPGSKHPQALIVTPTRELAEQIVSAIEKYCQFMPIKALAVYGGISARAQERALQQGVDIVVATPGRLIDHLQNAVIRLYNVKYLVLDEADRMLDMGFIPDIEVMMTYLPKDRQTLLFSATMPPQVEHLAQSLTQNATTIEAGVRSQAAKTVTQRLFKVAQTRKMELLLELLAEDVVDSVIVFSQTKHGADRVTRDLIGAGISATCIHSNYTQTQRQKSLDGFKKGDYSVMVATDIAARGIDIPAVSHVINFDTPQHAEDYVHRIGRTGRASTEGVALTFTSRNELKYLKNIEDLIGATIELGDEKNAAASAYPASKTPQPSSKKPVKEVVEDTSEAVAPVKKSRANVSKTVKKPKAAAVKQDAVETEPALEVEPIAKATTRSGRNRSRQAEVPANVAEAPAELETSETAEKSARRSSRRRSKKPTPQNDQAVETSKVDSGDKAQEQQVPMSSYERRRAQANQKQGQEPADEQRPARQTQAAEISNETTEDAEPSRRSGRSRSRRSRRNKSEQGNQGKPQELAIDTQNANEPNEKQEQNGQRRPQRRDRQRNQETQTDDRRSDARDSRQRGQQEQSRQEQPRNDDRDRPRSEERSRDRQEERPRNEERSRDRNRGRGQEDGRQRSRPEATANTVELGNEAVRPPEKMQLPKKQRSSRRQQADAIQNQETYTSTFYRNESDVDYIETDERQPDYVDANVWSYPMKQPYHQAQSRGGGGNRSGGGGNRSGDGNSNNSGNRSQSSGNRRSSNANSGGGNRSRRRR